MAVASLSIDSRWLITSSPSLALQCDIGANDTSHHLAQHRSVSHDLLPSQCVADENECWHQPSSLGMFESFCLPNTSTQHAITKQPNCSHLQARHRVARTLTTLECREAGLEQLPVGERSKSRPMMARNRPCHYTHLNLRDDHGSQYAVMCKSSLHTSTKLLGD